MQELRALIRELQGADTLTAFALRVGVSDSALGAVLLGERRMGRKLITALVAAYPERGEELTSLFLRQSDRNCENALAEEVTP